MSDPLAMFFSAIVGGAIGVVGTYLGAVRLSRINSKILAGLRLRDAFREELAKFQTSESFGITEVSDTLKNVLPKHQAAVTEFRFFLKGCCLKAFDETWEQYQKDKNFTKYMMQPDGVGPEGAIKDIQTILEFTKN